MSWFNIDENSKLYYEKHGDSDKTIIFVNGLVMTCKGWIKQRRFFSKNFTTIAYDQRCQGFSSKEENPFHYTLQVEDLKNLIEHLNLEKAIIVGISYGSIVAKEFAVKYPNLCEKLVLIAPIRYVDEGLKFAYKIWLDLLKKDQFEIFFNIITHMNFNRPSLNKWVELQDSVVEQMSKLLTSKDVILLLNSFDKDNDFDNYENIKVPTLVVGAKGDKIHNPDDAKKISEEIKDSQLSMFECGHGIIAELPDEFNKILDNFIK